MPIRHDVYPIQSFSFWQGNGSNPVASWNAKVDVDAGMEPTNSKKDKEIAEEVIDVPVEQENRSDKCERYAYSRINGKAGLGNQLGEMFFGMVFAMEQDAEFVLDREAFQLEGNHGSYPWVAEMLDMFGFRTLAEVKSRNDIKSVELKYRELASAYSDECGILLRADPSFCSFRDDPLHARDKATCFRARIGDYNTVKIQLRRRFNVEKLCPSEYAQFQSRKGFSVTWHLRTGDITLHENEDGYFKKVWSEVKKVLPNGYQLQFIGEKSAAEKFASLEDLTGGKVVDDLDPKQSLCQFLTSDMLIGSGSSFPTIAALLSDPISGPIVLQGKAKEGYYGIYELDDQGYITDEGTLIPPPSGWLLRRHRLTDNLKLKVVDHIRAKHSQSR